MRYTLIVSMLVVMLVLACASFGGLGDFLADQFTGEVIPVALEEVLQKEQQEELIQQEGLIQSEEDIFEEGLLGNALILRDNSKSGIIIHS